MNTPPLPLHDAATVLDTLAAGGVPERAALLSAALALSALCHRSDVHRELRDAAAGLDTLTTGGTLNLDAAGRERAAKLAAMVRAQAAA